MMNALALCLVLTSLVAAGIRSPPPPSTQPDKEVIVKEGHPAVEIEYERGGGSTKVKISPQDKDLHADSSSASSDGKVDEAVEHKGSAMEQICDALGRCKDKVTSAVGKSKEVLLEKAREVKDKAGEAEGKAKHTMRETLETVGDATTEGRSHGVADKVKEAAKDAAHSTKEKIKEVSQEAIDTGNTLQQDVRRNSTEYLLPLIPDSLIWASSSIKLLGMSLAFGMGVWVTFISTYITADALPRQQFANLQCKVYMVYFRVMAYGIGAALLSHCLSSGERLFSLQALNLAVSLAIALFNLKFMEPRANKLMFDTMRLEKEEGRGMERPTDEPSVVRNIDSLIAPLSGRSTSSKASANPSEEAGDRPASSSAARSGMVDMSEKLKKLNFYSSVLNIIVLLSITGHLLSLGQMVRA